eukprot:ctg_194.g128
MSQVCGAAQGARGAAVLSSDAAVHSVCADRLDFLCAVQRQRSSGGGGHGAEAQVQSGGVEGGGAVERVRQPTAAAGGAGATAVVADAAEDARRVRAGVRRLGATYAGAGRKDRSAEETAQPGQVSGVPDEAAVEEAAARREWCRGRDSGGGVATRGEWVSGGESARERHSGDAVATAENTVARAKRALLRRRHSGDAASCCTRRRGNVHCPRCAAAPPSARLAGPVLGAAVAQAAAAASSSEATEARCLVRQEEVDRPREKRVHRVQKDRHDD